jgi:formyltetrahydrofolate-dependent phosphoribosylglycinamide formyltransferase
MFEKLKQRWNVNTTDLLLIICTFALGGSLCGFLGRQLLSLTNLEKGIIWVIIYIVVITLLWPFCVLLISVFLGQFSFFKKYLSKIWKRISGKPTHPLCVAIFASGTGTNAEKIIRRFNTSNKTVLKGNSGGADPNKLNAKICLVVCNKPGAGVLQVAAKANVNTLIIEKEQFFRGTHYLPELKEQGIDFIILAGFLWKIPAALIKAYPNRIVNIHPALLPKHGGKGMYGKKVHEAVLAAGDKESGITIHYVDELYDHGSVIFQATCPVTYGETAETLAEKIHLLEHEHYPAVLERLLQNVK